MRSKGAFTLIELLVVIAIIAILAAILFPVMTKAKQTSLRASCLSNMEQIGKGLKLYAQDHSGFWPEMDHPIASPYQGRDDLNSWADVLVRTKYVSSKKVFVCPAARTPSENREDWRDPAIWDASPVDLGNNYARAAAWGFVPYQYSYGANYWLMGSMGSGNDRIKVDENWSVPVSRTIWIAEASWSWFQCQAETADGKWRPSRNPPDWYTLSMIAWRHPAPLGSGAPPPDGTGTADGAGNFLMLDGHCRWLGKYVRLATEDPEGRGFYINPPGVANPTALPTYGDFLNWFGTEF